MHVGCGTAPEFSKRVNGEFVQTWNGQVSRFEPRRKQGVCVPKESQGANIQCSFVCDNGYECNGNVGCKLKSCGDMPVGY